jgi:drug/metabolite transporter (DMT)-like permease
VELDAGEGPGDSVREGRRAHLAMICFVFLISTSFTVGEAIAPEIDPVVLTWLRFGLSAVIFAALIFSGQGNFKFPKPSNILRYSWFAFLLAFYFSAMFEALRWTDALSTSAIFTLVPPMTAIISFLILRQRLSLRQTCALLLAGIAAVWVLFDGSVELLLGFTIGKGETIFFVGCIAFASYAPSVRRLPSGQGLVEQTFWTLVAGTLLLTAYGWPRIVVTDWQEIPILVYLGAAHLTIFSTAISFYLLQFGSIHLPAAKVMAYTFLIPAFVLLQESALGEPWPSLSICAGVLVIASAMAVLQRGAAAGSLTRN